METVCPKAKMRATTASAITAEISVGAQLRSGGLGAHLVLQGLFSLFSAINPQKLKLKAAF